MGTTLPQWATPERQRHLVKLFGQHQNRCKEGHLACPDLRHHYAGCAVEHESVRTKELLGDIRALEAAAPEREVPSPQEKLIEDKRMRTFSTGQCMTQYPARERKRSILLAQAQNLLDDELARLRADCQIPEHYFEHMLRAMFDDAPAEIPLTYYRKMSEGAIDAWKADDREERSQLRKLEAEHIHDGTYGRWGSDFDPVTRDVYYQERPTYYMMGFGVSAESKQRIAVIRVPSTYIRLYVNVAPAFQDVSISRNKRRKMARYQSGPPAPVWERIDTLCSQAVQEYWASRSVKQ